MALNAHSLPRPSHPIPTQNQTGGATMVVAPARNLNMPRTHATDRDAGVGSAWTSCQPTSETAALPRIRAKLIPCRLQVVRQFLRNRPREHVRIGYPVGMDVDFPNLIASAATSARLHGAVA